jgi:hypothetical protein
MSTFKTTFLLSVLALKPKEETSKLFWYLLLQFSPDSIIPGLGFPRRMTCIFKGGSADKMTLVYVMESAALNRA